MSSDVKRLDGEDALANCAALMASSPPWSTLGIPGSACLAALRADDVLVYGVHDSTGALAGFVAVMPRGLGGEPLLEFLCVRSDLQGRGLGTGLVRFAEERLFPEASNIYLFVSDINPRAAALYDRLGYRQVGALPDFNRTSQTEFLLRKSRGTRPLA